MVGLVAVLAVAVAVPLVLAGPGSLDPIQPSVTATAGAVGGPTPALVPVTTPTLTPIATPTASPLATTDARPPPSKVPVVAAKRIRIERLGIDLAVVEGDGVDAPLNKAAHYPGTALPGEGSNIYLYGHGIPRAFRPLWDARIGDVVELELVDGSTRTYVVDEIRPQVPWDAIEILDPTPTEQLTLQTCNANSTPSTPRFVVIAHPADDAQG